MIGNNFVPFMEIYQRHRQMKSRNPADEFASYGQDLVN